MLLALPLVAGAVFGLFPLLIPVSFGRFLDFPGNDPFIYQLAGAATFGYTVALVLGLREGTWVAVKLPVKAVLTFNLASLYACGVELVSPSTDGRVQLIVYLILTTSVVFVVMTAWLLYHHRNDGNLAPDIASWVVALIVIATILAFVFGLLPLFYPQFGRLFGFKVTDLFLYRQADSSTLGYAVIGILELRSRNWQEIRGAFVMALVFNGLSFLAGILTLVLGESFLLTAVIVIATFSISAAIIVALRTQGGSLSRGEMQATQG